MSVHGLDKLFHPKSIAVFGADDGPGNMGKAVLDNLTASGFKGKVYPLHSTLTQICGLTCYHEIGDIGEPADLAVIATPLAQTPAVIDACIRAGVATAVLYAAGGQALAESGADLMKEIEQAANRSGLRIIGPNSLGVICTQYGLNVTPAHQPVRRGRLAFVSQSGALGTAMLDYAEKEHIGFSHFVDLGSMMDVDFGDVIDYLGSDPQAGSIILYLEQLNHIRTFMSAARAVSRIKPIIALKAGRTAAGARAAASHTGAPAGEDAIYDAVFQRTGILRVRTFEELFDCAELLAKQPRPRKPGLVIVSNAGGPSVMAADALNDYGIEPAELSQTTIAELEKNLPSFWSRANPIDIGIDAPAQRYLDAARIALQAPETSGLLLILAPQALTDATAIAQLLSDQIKQQPVPVITAWLGGRSVEAGREIFNRCGIPTFDSPERAVRAFVNLYQYGRHIEMLEQIPAKLNKRLQFDQPAARLVVDKHLNREESLLDDEAAGNVFSAYGLPPLKPDLSFHDPVRTGQSSGAYELMLRVKKDKDFGPVIAFGLGGDMTEIIHDRAYALPPLNRLLARRLMEETRIYKILCGQGQGPAADVNQIEEMIIRLAQLSIDFPEILEVDINPLIAEAHHLYAAKARIRLQAADVLSPMHLIISPYPNQLESCLEIPDLGVVQVRPIRPEDAPLMLALFNDLSSKSIYYRFFSPLKELPLDMLARFTQIDYDREIALVAVLERNDSEKMLAVARVIQYVNLKEAEFAVLVGDPWHGKGIGAALLRRCLQIAKQREIEIVWGTVLSENTGMLGLGRKLNFKIKRLNGTSEYELRLDLREIKADAFT